MSLVLSGVTKRFGAVVAIDRVSLEVPEGAVYGLVGPNGAGKTTTMRLIVGILAPDAGALAWQGRPLATAPLRTVGYLPEERGLYSKMRVAEQLTFFGRLYGLGAREAVSRVRELLPRYGLAEYAQRRLDELSKGNAQKAQLLAAALHQPRLLILDEPFSGLDPVNVALFKELIGGIHRSGATILFSSHRLDHVEELCSALTLINGGRVALQGPVEQVRAERGRQSVRIGIAGGDYAFAAGWSGAVRWRRPRFWEFDIPEGADPDALLQAALSAGRQVTHFEVTRESLEQIYIRLVGAAEQAPGSGKEEVARVH